MFEKSPRRHPVQTFQFWFIVLFSFGVVTAWKLDLFLSTSEPQSLTVHVDPEPMPPPPRVLKSRIAAEPITVEQPTADASAPFEGAMAQHESPVSSQISSPVEAEVMQEAMQSQIVRTAYVRQAPRAHEYAVARADMTVESTVESEAEPLVAPSPPAVNLAEADELLRAGREVEALRLYSKWYWTCPEQRSKFMDRLTLLSGKIYFQPEPHYLAPCVVKFGDQLENIAARYQVTPQYLTRLNRIDPSKLNNGQSLKVLQGPFSAVLDLSDMDLTVHSNGYFLARLKIGLGGEVTLIPGTYQVTEKVQHPKFTGGEVEVAGGDPTNPLGSRWIEINDESGTLHGFGFHGTNNPQMVGQIAGEGCVRLKNSEIEVLYDLLIPAAEVVIKP